MSPLKVKTLSVYLYERHKKDDSCYSYSVMYILFVFFWDFLPLFCLIDPWNPAFLLYHRVKDPKEKTEYIRSVLYVRRFRPLSFSGFLFGRNFPVDFFFFFFVVWKSNIGEMRSIYSPFCDTVVKRGCGRFPFHPSVVRVRMVWHYTVKLGGVPWQSLSSHSFNHNHRLMCIRLPCLIYYIFVWVCLCTGWLKHVSTFSLSHFCPIGELGYYDLVNLWVYIFIFAGFEVWIMFLIECYQVSEFIFYISICWKSFFFLFQKM